MMVSFSNGCVSGDAPNKRPLENGDVPKYKPRKVSAVRDFPPRCGHDDVLMNMSPEQYGANAHGMIEGLGFQNSEIADSPGVESSNGGVPDQLDEALRNNEDVNMAEQMDAFVEIGRLGIQLPKDDIVNNPLEVERVGPLDAFVGKVTTTTTGADSLNDVERSISETELIDVAKLNEIKNDSSVSITSEMSIFPKDKYCRRRVSAVRDFPPYCGRNALLRAKSEELKVAPGNGCLDENVTVEVNPEATILRHVVDGVAMGEMVVTSQKERLDESDNIHIEKETTERLDDGGRGPPGEMLEDTNKYGFMDSEECNRQAVPGLGTWSNALADTNIQDTENKTIGRETAVCSPDRNDEVQTPRSGSNTGSELRWEIVHGLMAAPYCPWRKGKLALNNSDGGASGGKVRKQNLSRQKKSKAVNLKNKEDCSGGQSVEKDMFPASDHPDGSPGSRTFMGEEYNGASNESEPLIIPISVAPPVIDSTVNSPGMDIVVYSPWQSDEMRHSHHGSSSGDEEIDRVLVHGPKAACDRSSRKCQTISSNPDRKVSREKKGKQKLSWREKAKAVARKSAPKAKSSVTPSKKCKEICVYNDADESPSAVPAADETDDHEDSFPANSLAICKATDIEVSLPPFGPKSSGNGDARNRVRETLRMFNAFCRKLLQQEESHSMQEEEGKSTGKKPKRIDLLSAKMIKQVGKEVNTEKQYLGQVPGVEVGDEFQYRVELAVIGIHRLYQAGIDWMKVNGVPVATSIVSSGAYSDDVENADVLIYSGQGGNVVGKCKEPEDQKLERGNLALKNSIDAQTPVRVIRGWKEARVMDPLDPRPKMVTIYVYDGLYTVKEYWPETGPKGKRVFMFKLTRNPGQPELAWKELKKSNKFKVRPGMVVSDISGGKEPFAICAVNTIDDEKPPPFNYISKMMYPEWFKPTPPAGCDCTGRCSDSKKCRCAVRNGGEIPYNRNGAIVETKTLVYECGPWCRCPSSCYNRVSQRGVKSQLEIFKTDSRGWGVRALTSIPSGSFICEYAGELLEDKEAEQRIGNDEYLFDIGQNYSDTSVMAEEKAAIVEIMEGGYTIDAAQYGNVGRFINHSCSPNLYAQNVIYDHDDKKMPHVMLFAMENIPPLQELTYHYNYSVDQIRDSNGNIKVKKCYCGSTECTGRMY